MQIMSSSIQRDNNSFCGESDSSIVFLLHRHHPIIFLLDTSGSMIENSRIDTLNAEINDFIFQCREIYGQVDQVCMD